MNNSWMDGTCPIDKIPDIYNIKSKQMSQKKKTQWNVEIATRSIFWLLLGEVDISRNVECLVKMFLTEYTRRVYLESIRVPHPS